MKIDFGDGPDWATWVQAAMAVAQGVGALVAMGIALQALLADGRRRNERTYAALEMAKDMCVSLRLVTHQIENALRSGGHLTAHQAKVLLAAGEVAELAAELDDLRADAFPTYTTAQAFRELRVLIRDVEGRLAMQASTAGSSSRCDVGEWRERLEPLFTILSTAAWEAGVKVHGRRGTARRLTEAVEMWQEADQVHQTPSG